VLTVLGTADAVVVDVVAEEEEVLLFVDVIVPAAVDAAAEDVLLLADVLIVVGVETMPV
jgi:hypothetical protein